MLATVEYKADLSFLRRLAVTGDKWKGVALLETRGDNLAACMPASLWLVSPCEAAAGASLNALLKALQRHKTTVNTTIERMTAIFILKFNLHCKMRVGRRNIASS